MAQCSRYLLQKHEDQRLDLQNSYKMLDGETRQGVLQSKQDCCMTERPWLSECAGRMIEADSCHQLGASTCTHTYVYTIVWSHRQTWIHTYRHHTNTWTWKNKQQTALLTQHGNGQGWAERPLLYVWFVLFLTVGATHAEQQRQQTQKKKKLSSVWWEVPSCQSKLAHPRSSQEIYLLCPTGLQSYSLWNEALIHFKIYQSV